MKNTNIIIGSTVASLLCSVFASAGQSASAVQPAATSAITGYAEISAVTGSGTLSDFSESVTSLSQDASGARLNGGLLFGNGFSLDGRYEHVDAESAVNLDEARALLNYTQEIAPDISAFFGVGYGTQQLDVVLANLNSNAILANVGIGFTSGQFFGSAVYTHAFTTSASMSALDVLGSGAGYSNSFSKVDIGYLEANLGYRLKENLSAVASIETQVVGDSMVQKDWLAGLGLRFGF